MSEIKDSGDRRKFETGAVRDIQKGKGRCDLLPLDIIAEFLNFNGINVVGLKDINAFMKTNDKKYLFQALSNFIEFNYANSDGSYPAAMLDLAKHFEDGAEKYGERNWEQGIPIHCYIDSAVRHLLKYMAGEKDEHHDRAFMWNIICCIRTMNNKPEMNDIKRGEEK